MPSLSNKNCKEFTNLSDYCWSQFTNCISFSRRPSAPPSPNRQQFHTFHGELQTDGVSVSVLMFQHQPQPQPAQTPSTSNPKGQKRKQEQQTGAEWVRDSSDRNIGQIHRVVGLDPSHSLLPPFTASQQQTACRNSAPMEQSTPHCHGVATDGRKLVASTTESTKLNYGSVVTSTSKLPWRRPPQPR